MTDESAPACRPETAGWEATRADVVRQLRACLDEHSPAAMAVITAVEGSAYRRPGARLLLSKESSRGRVSADSVEGPLARSARAAVSEGVLSTERYDLSSDDAESLGMGLGANGVVDVLVDPVDASLHPALDAIDRNERAVVATVLSVEGATEAAETEISAGDRTTVLADGSLAGGEHVDETDRGTLPEDLLDAVSTAVPESLSELTSSRTVSVSFRGAEVSVFCDVFEPIPTLLVFGSQGDVRPVTRFARETGFRVAVLTARSGRADPERFPAADSVRSVPPAEVDQAVEAPEHTYAVLMSHEFREDRLALASLLETDVPSIGVMGPRKRFEGMRDKFAEAGRPLSAADRDRIATPVGLDLGGDEPTQIAMSVVAEALAVANDRSGGRLSNREGPVHDR